MSRTIRPLIGVLALTLLSGCSGEKEKIDESYAPTIDPAQFVAAVNNPYFPLVPGTTFVYESAEGEERVEVNVTAETKQIMGVTCTAVHTSEYAGERLTEETVDWYAQDADGTVWYFGEDTKAYDENGKASDEGSWEAGRHGALPGIIMKAAPGAGDSYRQEYYPGHAEDHGEILDNGVSVTVPYGTYDDALLIRDWSDLEPDTFDWKYYVPNVGLVLEAEGGTHRIELVSVTTEVPSAG
jgi:hypothetical protein